MNMNTGAGSLIDEETLYRAVVIGQLETIQELFQQCSILPNYTFSKNFKKHSVARLPILHLALREKQVAIADFLINNGTDVNILDGETTALYYAVKNGLVEISQLLLKNGANISLGFQCKGGLIRQAIEYNHFDIVKVLVDHSRSLINSDCSEGLTPLHVATANQNIPMMQLLMDSGAQLDRASEFQGSAICIAARKLFQRGVLTLLQHGSSPNVSFVDSNTTDESPIGLASPIGYIISPFQLIMKRLTIRRINTDIALLKLLVRSGLDLNMWCNAHVLDTFGQSVERNPRRGRALYTWLTQIKQNPKSLKQTCFENIRGYLITINEGTSLMKYLDALPLPSLIISYLKMEDATPSFEVDFQGFYNKKAVLVR